MEEKNCCAVVDGGAENEKRVVGFYVELQNLGLLRGSGTWSCKLQGANNGLPSTLWVQLHCACASGCGSHTTHQIHGCICRFVTAQRRKCLIARIPPLTSLQPWNEAAIVEYGATQAD